MADTTFTKKHRKFFSQPRTMQEVTELFDGDPWAANNFQTVNLIGRNIKLIHTLGGMPCSIKVVNYDWIDINEDTARYAAH